MTRSDSLEGNHQHIHSHGSQRESLPAGRNQGNRGTELLGCYSNQDFLAKLHCVRQAFQELLQTESNQTFFGEVGKHMVLGLMTKAEKNTKGFLESYDEMLRYTLRQETWPTTQKELEGRGVVCMSFFDIVLDFILMDAFEDLENPPSSVLAVLRNRWLSDSFKETVCHFAPRHSLADF
uniref:Mitoguardin 2 n=1 Tax=Sphaerodactylus townsendi TaxID=933632 RepID=A0ACB8F0P1_9SAUR